MHRKRQNYGFVNCEHHIKLGCRVDLFSLYTFMVYLLCFIVICYYIFIYVCILYVCLLKNYLQVCFLHF